MTSAPDITWVTDLLPDAPAPEPEVTERAYLALMDHLAQASPAPSPTRRGHRLRSRHPRRVMQLGLVAAGAAAVAAVVVNVGTSGHGSVAEAQAAQIIAHARRALAVAPGQVLGFTVTDTADDGAAQITEDGASPQNFVKINIGSWLPTFDGRHEWIIGEENGRREFLDPSTGPNGTIYRDSDSSDSYEQYLPAADQSWMQGLQQYAKTTVTQNTTFDGRPATKLTGTYANGDVDELWVDPSNGDRPLQFNVTSGGHTSGGTWSNYQTSTPGAGGPSPAMLSELYPSATVTTLDRAAFGAMAATVYRDAGGASGRPF